MMQSSLNKWLKRIIKSVTTLANGESLLIGLDSHSTVRDVEIFQDLVIICPFRSTWAGYEPFHTILSNLGAKVNSSHEDGLSLAINLECDVPSAQAAQTIVEEMKVPQLHEDWVWIRVHGLGDSRRTAETKLFADGRHLVIKNFRLVSMTTSRQWLSLGDNLKRLIAFFQKEGCTNIQYSFSTN